MLHPITRLHPYINVTEVKSIWYLHMCDPSCSACFSQNVQNISLLPQGTSPPKPPRAHELKLLVKNIVVNLTDHSAAGNVAHAMLLLFKQDWVFYSFRMKSFGSSGLQLSLKRRCKKLLYSEKEI